MKKYLYTLLFMAVALISAATLASCGDDDEPVSRKNKFTLTFEVNTNNPEVRESAAYKTVVANMQAEIQEQTKREFYLTDTEADHEWGKLEFALRSNYGIQTLLDNYAKLLNDKTLSCSFKMLKEGKVYQHYDWKTNYYGL
ncbi:MAG: hypothetical protein MJZ32_07970 [Bacteroidaceae bacterium]|nr:hypothetical protein [Bacteroidaceae bacterium]